MSAMCPLSTALPAKGFKGKAGSGEQGGEVSAPRNTSWALPQAPAGCSILGGQLYLPQQAGGLEVALVLCQAKAELCTQHMPSPLCHEQRPHSSARAHIMN